jgi:hypothetical protein
VMLIASLLVVIKYVVWVFTKGETGMGGPGGLGGNWAVDGECETSAEHTHCCVWRVTTPSRRFLITHPHTIAQDVLRIVYKYFFVG